MKRPVGLPETIQVGTIPYDVNFGRITAERARVDRPDLADLSGLVVHRDAALFFSDDAAPEVLRDTVLHECLHAIFFSSGIYLIGQDDDIEEKMCVQLTQWLLMLLRDNPKLVKYLTR
jgi:hypothetical protein